MQIETCLPDENITKIESNNLVFIFFYSKNYSCSCSIHFVCSVIEFSLGCYGYTCIPIGCLWIQSPKKTHSGRESSLSEFSRFSLFGNYFSKYILIHLLQLRLLFSFVVSACFGRNYETVQRVYHMVPANYCLALVPDKGTRSPDEIISRTKGK